MSIKAIKSPIGIWSFDTRTGQNSLDPGNKSDAWQPVTVALSITNQCSKTCAFCYASSVCSENAKNMSYTDILSFAKDLAANQVFSLMIGGGEPFEWMDGEYNIYHLLHALSELDIAVSVTTAKRDILAACLPANVTVRLSLHSPEEVDEVLETARKLYRYALPVGINVLWRKSKAVETLLAVKQILNHGYTDIIHLPLKPYGRATNMTDDTMRPAELSFYLKQINLSSQSIARVSSCSPMPLDIMLDMGCGAGDYYVHITPDKQLKACSYSDLSIPVNEMTYAGLLEAYANLPKPACHRLSVSPPAKGMTWKAVPSSHSNDTSFYILDKNNRLGDFYSGEDGCYLSQAVGVIDTLVPNTIDPNAMSISLSAFISHWRSLGSTITLDDYFRAASDGEDPRYRMLAASKYIVLDASSSDYQAVLLPLLLPIMLGMLSVPEFRVEGNFVLIQQDKLNTILHNGTFTKIQRDQISELIKQYAKYVIPAYYDAWDIIRQCLYRYHFADHMIDTKTGKRIRYSTQAFTRAVNRGDAYYNGDFLTQMAFAEPLDFGFLANHTVVPKLPVDFSKIKSIDLLKYYQRNQLSYYNDDGQITG